MWSALRSRTRLLPLPSPPYFTALPSRKLGRTLYSTAIDSHAKSGSSGADNDDSSVFLNLQEVVTVLNDVKADGVNVIPVGNRCDWADYMIFASGRSPWHVRNIAQALIYQTKLKQFGSKRLLLPSVEGQEKGRWIIIDSGSIIIHALDENARAYYSMESLWTGGISQSRNKESIENLELDKAFVKVRRTNNSKRRVQKST